MPKNSVFKTEKLFFVKDFLIINGLLLLLFAFRNDNPFVEASVVGVLNVVRVFYFFFKRNVLLLAFRDEGLFIKTARYFKVKTATFDYRTLQFSYEDGLVGRGMVDKVLKLYDGNGLLASMYPAFTGFSKAQILEIMEALEQHQVERVELDI